MKVGLALPALESPDLGRAPSYAEVRAMALAAEQAGFDSLWLFDHLLYQRWDGAPLQGVWECWTFLAALADATRRIELGTLVTCTQFRNPALLAKMAAALDEISGGRFTLGIGAGWHAPEFAAFGVPFDHRAGRFDEAIRIIQPLLKTGHVDFHGRYYQAADCDNRPRGPSAGGVRLLVGGSGPRLMDLTARFADLWNTGYVAGLDALAQKQAAIAQACRAAGRDPATLELTVHLPLVFTDLAAPPPFLPEYLSGDAGQIAARLEQFAAAGVGHTIVECFPAGRAAIERLAAALPIYAKR